MLRQAVSLREDRGREPLLGCRPQPDTESPTRCSSRARSGRAANAGTGPRRTGARAVGRRSSDNRFRTFRIPRIRLHAAFAVIGDFGVGVRKDSPTRRQQQVADALRRMVDSEGVRLRPDDRRQHLRARARVRRRRSAAPATKTTTGSSPTFSRIATCINRIPVYPSIGNHDADETEGRDDRAQVEDNFYLRERMGGRGGGTRLVRPGLVLSIPLRRGHRVRLHRHVEGGVLHSHRLFEFPKHWEFIEQSFPAEGPHPTWRIPFAHHPLYSAGPQHHNTRSMQELLPLFERSNVQVMFTGHEHNFQHSRIAGFDHFVTGAAGKARRSPPDGFAEAHTVSWATDCHFLLARIEGRRMWCARSRRWTIRRQSSGHRALRSRRRTGRAASSKSMQVRTSGVPILSFWLIRSIKIWR